MVDQSPLFPSPSAHYSSHPSRLDTMWSSSPAAAAVTATLLLALPLTVSASAPLAGGRDCSSRADGFYALGCSSAYLGCVAGDALDLVCPAHLVYDESREQCEYPGNVVACGGVAPEEGSGIDEGSGGVTEGSGVDGSGEGSGKEIEDVTGMCVDREDGFYRLAACGERFLGCSGGVAWPMTCPASLKYDEQNQICDYPGNVEGCEGAESSGEEEGSGEVEGSGTEEGSGIEGSGEGSGIEGSGEGSGIEGSGEGSGIEGSGEGSGVEGSGEEIEDVTGMCVDREDGFYRLAACGERFLGCSGGVAWPMTCPASLKYDEQNQICDYPGNVEGCGARDQLAEDSLLTGSDDDQTPEHPEIPRTRDSEVAPTTPAGPTAATAAVAAEYAFQTAATTTQGPRKYRRDAGCKSPSGLFSLDCSVEFVSCHEGVATKLECPVGEAFEERALSCVPLARHPICFAHAIQKDVVVDEDVQMGQEEEHDDEADLQKPIDHSFACDWVGARAEEECADWFRLCEAGRGIEMYCLQGHLFDGAAAKCVPAGQLAHCKAQ